MNRIKFKGIIFDMDGTLTVPSIDFVELRRILGVLPGQDLLGVLSSYNEKQKKRHLSIIEQYERKALENIRLQPNVNQVLTKFAAAGIRMAVITRNSKFSAEKVLSLLDVEFNPVLTRDFEQVKPDPAPVNYILRYWDIGAENVLMVGDFRDDIICGKNAGTSTCFFINSGKVSFAESADFAVNSFADLERIVSE